MMLYLGILSYQDLRKRKIAIPFLLFGILLAIASMFLMREVVWWERVAGAFIGILMLGVCKVTKEAIGMADCILILYLGIMEGYLSCICMLCYTTFLCCIFCIGCLGFKIITKKQRIPFIPFLLLGFTCHVLLRAMS